MIPILLQVLCGTGFTFSMTALGAAVVFFFRGAIGERLNRAFGVRLWSDDGGCGLVVADSRYRTEPGTGNGALAAPSGGICSGRGVLIFGG